LGRQPVVVGVRLASAATMPQSYITVREGGPSSTLTLGADVRSVAHECRSATLAFLRGSGWGKRELAGWLVTRYQPLCSMAKTVRRDEAPASEAPPSSRLDARHNIALPEVIREAKRRTLAAIEAALAAETRVGVEELDSVARVRDLLGEQGWVPVDHRRMRLSDRVVSLVTAHRLTLPSEFGESWVGLRELLEEVAVDDAWNASA
jgi:hypothetical protein